MVIIVITIIIVNYTLLCRMKLFLDDETAVNKLVASQYKIVPEKLLRQGAYNGQQSKHRPTARESPSPFHILSAILCLVLILLVSPRYEPISNLRPSSGGAGQARPGSPGPAAGLQRAQRSVVGEQSGG